LLRACISKPDAPGIPQVPPRRHRAHVAAGSTTKTQRTRGALANRMARVGQPAGGFFTASHARGTVAGQRHCVAKTGSSPQSVKGLGGVGFSRAHWSPRSGRQESLADRTLAGFMSPRTGLICVPARWPSAGALGYYMPSASRARQVPGFYTLGIRAEKQASK